VRVRYKTGQRDRRRAPAFGKYAYRVRAHLAETPRKAATDSRFSRKERTDMPGS
jgi:hypothetical protein